MGIYYSINGPKILGFEVLEGDPQDVADTLGKPIYTYEKQRLVLPVRPCYSFVPAPWYWRSDTGGTDDRTFDDDRQRLYDAVSTNMDEFYNALDDTAPGGLDKKPRLKRRIVSAVAECIGQEWKSFVADGIDRELFVGAILEGHAAHMRDDRAGALRRDLRAHIDRYDTLPGMWLVTWFLNGAWETLFLQDFPPGLDTAMQSALLRHLTQAQPDMLPVRWP